MGQPLWHRH
ncbi:hypothetical protein YPPY56_2917, partial [Yersinia pestis PY-56]